MSESTEENYCTLYLVRHGETEFNVAGIMQGHADSPLTENGIKQVESTRDKLAEIKFDMVFSSDLSRAVHTAEIIKLDKEILLETSELLRERSFGRFDGAPSAEYSSALKEKLQEREKLADEEAWVFEVDPTVETDEATASRFILKLREIALACPGKNVLVVSHGSILRMFLIKVGHGTRKELPPHSIKNAAYIKVISDGVNFFVKETEGVEKAKISH